MHVNRPEENNNEPINIDADVAKAKTSDADIRHVAGLLHSFLADQAINEAERVDHAVSGPSKEDMKAMMAFLLKCVQEVQINLGKLNQTKDEFSAEIGKAQLTAAVNAAKDAADKYAEYERQKAEAQKAQEAMKIVSCVMMVLAVVLGALTGGIAGALIAGVMVTMQATGVFDKLTEALQNECGLTKEQANAVVFVIILAASLGTSIGSAALKGATTAAEKAIEKTVVSATEKVIKTLKEVVRKDLLMGVATAATTSGVVADFSAVVVDAVFDNMDFGMSKEDKEKAKAIAKIVVTIVLSIYMMSGAMVHSSWQAANSVAGAAKASTNLVASGFNKLFSNVVKDPQALLNNLQMVLRGTEFAGQLATSGSEIAEGAIGFEASKILSDVAKAEGKRSLYTAFAENTQKSAELDREDFLSAMRSIESLLNRVMEGFKIPDSEARALS